MYKHKSPKETETFFLVSFFTLFSHSLYVLCAATFVAGGGLFVDERTQYTKYINLIFLKNFRLIKFYFMLQCSQH